MTRVFCLLSLLLLLSFSATTVLGAPVVELRSSAASAEKGHDFQIYVEIRTDEKLGDVTITGNEPEGFYIAAIPSPGITIDKQEKLHNVARVEGLSAGSSITVPFRVRPPDLSGKPHGAEKESLYSTREPKTFAFNVLYNNGTDGVTDRGVVTRELKLRYTTSLGHYLLASLLGVFLGFVVKTATQYNTEISESIGSVTTLPRKVVRFFYEIFIARLALLITLLVVGFGVLLGLAQDSLPVSSWHQAIALGMGVGVLSDEQLITKVKHSLS